MVTFTPNNIIYRSVAACALEHFYGAKSYMLNVAVNEQNQFSETARETLLLLFNSYCKWAQIVESLFLNKPILTRSEVEACIDVANEIQNDHQYIFREHPHIFNPKFMQIWYEANAHTRQAFRNTILSTEGQSHLEAYPLIIAALGSALQMCMYELYEVDCLLGSDLVSDQCTTNRSNSNRMVLYVDNFALDYHKKTGIFMCLERLKVYSQVTACRIPALVKNHTTSNLRYTGTIEGDDPLASLLQQCVEYVNIIDVETPPPTPA